MTDTVQTLPGTHLIETKRGGGGGQVLELEACSSSSWLPRKDYGGAAWGLATRVASGVFGSQPVEQLPLVLELVRQFGHQWIVGIWLGQQGVQG